MKHYNKQMAHKVLILFFFLLISSGCNRENDVLGKYKQEISLTIQREVIINHQLNPKQIYLMNDVIVLQNDDTDGYRFSIIDTVNFQLLARFGCQGSGPNEIGAVCRINKINGDSIIVGDIDMESYLFSIKKIIEGDLNPIKVYAPTDENGKIRSGSITIIGDVNFVITTGMFAKGRYAILDTTDKIKAYYVAYPEFDNPDNDSLLQALAFQSVLCNRNKDNMFASISNGIIDIAKCKPSGEIVLITRNKYYDTEKKHTRNVSIDGTNIPVVATSVMAMAGFDEWHFQGTANRIYCLFTPKKFENFMGHGERLAYSDLLSMDWNGKQQTHYLIGREVNGCAVSDDDSIVYFLAHNENDDPVILKSYLK